MYILGNKTYVNLSAISICKYIYNKEMKSIFIHHRHLAPLHRLRYPFACWWNDTADVSSLALAVVRAWKTCAVAAAGCTTACLALCRQLQLTTSRGAWGATGAVETAGEMAEPLMIQPKLAVFRAFPWGSRWYAAFYSIIWWWARGTCSCRVLMARVEVSTCVFHCFTSLLSMLVEG